MVAVMGGEQSRTNGGGGAIPPGVTTLRPNLQKRFAKGIQYNSKICVSVSR